MLDFFNINDGSANKSIFYANGPMYVTSLSAITQTAFQIWQKPNGVKFVHFFVMGAGAGGGNSSNATVNAKGGGGGGSAGHVTGLFLASVLPDTLYINVGVGGVGGGGISGTQSTGNGGDGSGGNGALSYVMIYPDTGFTATNVVLQSGSAAAVGGRTGGSASTNGQAGTVWTPTGNLLSKLGLVSAYAGQAGVAGVTSGVGANLLISGITTGGGGGAGTSSSVPFNGGSIIGYGNVIPTVSGGTSASTLTTSGTSGYMLSIPNTVGMANNPMFFAGGAGGASSSVAGGRGGNGAFGSGGGGGGGISSGSNKGSGGRGGDGIVIITCW
jgi:hypothetical protein